MPRLSRKEETLAKARAEKSGRPYPNPIDVNAVVRLRVPRLGGVRRG
jgi:hypothetical protein